MSDYMESPVIIDTKDQLKDVFNKRFTVNSDDYQIGNDVWASGSLFFLGFAGSLHTDGKYHGVYRFRCAQPKDGERDGIVLCQLPGAHGYELKKTKAKKKGKK